MRVLVTGNLGYVGTIVTPALLRAGFEVTGLDSDLWRGCTYGFGRIVEVPQLEKDIRDVGLPDLEGFDALVHLAGLSSDPLGDLNPDLTFEINHRAVVHLARLAKMAGIPRFVFSSSCSNYGDADPGEGFLDESCPVSPMTPYACSKVMVERDLSRLAGPGFSPTFLRNAIAFGASPRLRFDLIVNDLVARAYTTGRIRLEGDGLGWRTLVHVQDIARAFVAALKAPREVVHDKAFNVGQTSENYRLRDVARIVQAVVSRSELEIVDDPAAHEPPTYRVNCDLAQRALPDFRPTWTVRQGAEELYEAFQRAGLQRDELEGPRFQRTAHVRRLLAEAQVGQDLRRL